MKKHRYLIATGMLLAALAPLQTHAAANTWTGAGSSYWDTTTANWTSPTTWVQGGDAVFNAEALRALLGGTKNAYRDIVILNAAAALVVAGKAANIRAGAVMAGEAIDSGAAQNVLEKLVKLTNQA